MLKLCLWLSFAIALLLVGSRSSQRRQLPAQELESAVRELKKRAAEERGRGEFHAAAEIYRHAYDRALAGGSPAVALGCLNNAASAQLAGYEYAAALQSFLRARQLAQRLNNRPMQAVVWLNLSSLYFTLRNYAAAEQAALQASDLVRDLPNFAYRAEVLAQLASFRTRRGDYHSGLRLFQEAINHASDNGNESLRAILNDRAGWLLLERGSYREAEPFVTEAFRLRVLARERDLRPSYISASRLKLAQGDQALAAALIDRLASLPIRDAGPALWLGYYQLGLVRMAQSRIHEARVAFAQALDAAQAWHEGAAFSDQSRMAADVGLHELAQAFVDASVDSGDTVHALLAAEQDRAAGLRQVTQNVRRAAALTPEFSNALSRLRQAQTTLLVKTTEEGRRMVEQLRSELHEMEASRYLMFSPHTANKSKNAPSPYSLRNIQERIRPGEALLSFYAGPKCTYLWAMTASHFEFHRLPGEAALAELASRFASSVEQDALDRTRLSEQLYQDLFGQLSATIHQQDRWIVTASDALFRIPFPALIAARPGQPPAFLTELHSVLRVPSAWMLSAEGSQMSYGAFVGVGDGIYNQADPRWTGLRSRTAPLQLARLAASGLEVEACGRQWAFRSPAKILTGIRASRQDFQIALQQRPAVIHIAAHFLYPEDRRDQIAIDLGLSQHGQPELLTQEDVANWNVPDSVVVMSGCNSAASGAAAGAGILGLSRAWLMAGASTVVGSFWPTPDDSGELFRSFYAHLAAGLRAGMDGGPIERMAADALRSAQMDMVRSASWRSQPKYWSAFYAVGKD